jgi:integrase
MSEIILSGRMGLGCAKCHSTWDSSNTRNHSMRRQFADVQELAGHASLATTQRYIDGDAEAKRRVVR